MRTGRAIGSFVIAAGWLLPGPRPAAAAQMRAGINPDTIYLGTRTLLEVEVLNPTTNDWPEVATVEGLVIKRYGGPNTIHDLFSGNVRRSFQFLIDPQRAGDFVIPSVTFGRGGDALTDGPFTLHVKEAPLKFVSAEIDREELRPGEQAVVTVAYQGHRPDKRLTLPEVEGLVLRDLGPPRIEMTRPEGVPLSIFRIEVTAVRHGTYTLQGISLEGVAAGPVALKVSPFVIVGAQVGDSSLVVGGQTLVHVLARGLERTADVRLVAPAGLKIEPARRQYQYPGSPDTTVFSFEVTATEPGSPVIRSLQLPDGSMAALPKPVALSVRQAGAGDILAARGAVRVQQSVIGEPVIVDYEVFFRGEFRAAAIDLSQTAFANRPYIKVEPVNDLAYPDWSGRPIQVGFGPREQATALSGAGEINGQKEQLLRFALRITPMAAGELELKGLRVVVQIMVNEQRTIGGGAFQGLSVYRGTQEFVRTIDVPPHRVVDPPGKRQPPGYFGAVGRAFSFLTTLDRTTASAMSPLTLTLKITGEGVGPHFKPPPLTSIPELTRGFEVSPNVGGGEVQGDTITFTQVVRPRSEAVTELPALPLVYYNYVTKEYETTYSLPIPIRVTPGALVGATAMRTGEGTSRPSGDGDGAEPAARLESLGANYASLGEPPAGPLLGTGGVMAVLLGGPAALAAVWAGQRWRRRRQPLAEMRRCKRDLLAGLDRVGTRDDFHAALADLVQSYLRLTFGLPPGEVSAETLERVMRENAIPAELRRSVETLLSECDTGRFAAARAEEAEKARLIGVARSVFAGLDRI